MYQSALVIGGGAFGTSVATILCRQFETVYLKVRSMDTFDSINRGENSIYLPGQKLPKNLKAVMDWEDISTEARNKIQLVVNGLPTSALQNYYQENFQIFHHFLSLAVPFVSLSKGIDTVSLQLCDDIFNRIFPNHTDLFCYLSGPSFAKEIIEEQITLASLAGKDRATLLKVCQMMQTDYFKLMPTYDIKGLLLGGALKNIVAIAGGIVEGLGFNHNTRAALITRGIVEMLRFGKVYNARPETFYGLSGMGDLILTTTGDLSRNKVFGMELAKGRSVQEILQSQRSVVEGHKSTEAAYRIAQKYAIRTRIFHGMYQVLYENASIQKIIKELMNLPSKFDDDN
jgi:glycerol-3-phosphate dehydrogenase (NAD(P)+)